MVPKLDLANHSFDANSEWAADFCRGTLTLTATQDISAAEPICIDYGPDLDNTHLMRVFGFVVPGNPNDRLAFLQQDNASDNEGAMFGENGHQQVLLAGPFLKSVGLDSVVQQFERQDRSHSVQGIISCHEDPHLSRKLSALLSLPVSYTDQHANGADGDDRGQVPHQGMSK